MNDGGSDGRVAYWPTEEQFAAGLRLSQCWMYRDTSGSMREPRRRLEHPEHAR